MESNQQRRGHYIVMTASAPMPTSVKAKYRRVAVVEVEGDGVVPKMISPRARGVVRIVETWERCNVGKNIRSAYKVALREAQAMANRLNNGAS